MTKSIRPMGDVMLSLEKVVTEMCVQHDLQWGEVMGLVHTYLQIHFPGQQEEYLDKSHPIYYYGPKNGK